jgi:hypothetical membrane protein
MATDEQVQRFPVALTRPVIAGAACWSLAVLFFVDQAIVQAATTRPYGMATNLISDLGITACGPFTNGSYHVDVCSPLHAVMDGTFIAVGLLHAVGAIATRAAWPDDFLSTAGRVLMMLAGAGLVVTGFTPENVNPSLHGSSALLGLGCLNTAMILLGFGLLKTTRGLGTLALIAGIIGWAGTIVLLQGIAGIPIGTAERIADYPSAAMVVVLGAAILWPKPR